jgi:hypothetical protein
MRKLFKLPVALVLPVPPPQFVQSYMYCLPSPVVGEIWQRHMIHRQLQRPDQVTLAWSIVCANRHSLCGNGIATVDYRLDETQQHHRPVTRRFGFRPFKST